MKILIDIGHPAHVHFFKNAIRKLRREGNEVLISARSKDVTKSLLDAFNFDYRELSAIGSGWLGPYREFIKREFSLANLIRRFKPDVIAAVGGAFVAPVGRLTGTPTVVFTDTEHVAIDRLLTYPWATRICTPRVFKKELGCVQDRYDGFQELAYLHPRYFHPNPDVLTELGLLPGDRFSVLRFVSWQATHDRGETGLASELKRDAVSRLRRYGPVFVTSEAPLPLELEAYALRIAPHRVHDVLAFAGLYLGEGATMATEAALLGTPSVYVSSLVGTMGNFQELQKEGLIQSFRDGKKALDRSETLLGDQGAKPAWQERSSTLVNRLVDVTEYVCEQVLEVAGAQRPS